MRFLHYCKSWKWKLYKILCGNHYSEFSQNIILTLTYNHGSQGIRSMSLLRKPLKIFMTFCTMFLVVNHTFPNKFHSLVKFNLGQLRIDEWLPITKTARSWETTQKQNFCVQWQTLGRQYMKPTLTYTRHRSHSTSLTAKGLGLSHLVPHKVIVGSLRLTLEEG